MTKITVGFAMCGSFCTFSDIIPQISLLLENDFDVVPIMSQTAYSLDTRFGKADDFIQEIEGICKRKIICTINEAEPIGPKALLDILVIAPCTGNTLGKLANGITDTSVTMAAKAHLRNGRPVLLGISTNDALGTCAKNIGQLFNYKNIYFIPMRQDNAQNKPNSVISDFSKTLSAINEALQGRQLQPVLL
ncbi:MAG: dipicolinate synthase subunit B [Oscillospiraceae bacterium]|jgi:dipicolinate synthase subunit B|nr:dipicolinate synthase subunit B [Oscillospiraceae bacterium]